MLLVRYWPMEMLNLLRQSVTYNRQLNIQISYDSVNMVDCCFFFFIAYCRLKLQQLQNVCVFFCFMHTRVSNNNNYKYLHSVSCVRCILARFLCQVFDKDYILFMYYMYRLSPQMNVFVYQRMYQQGGYFRRQIYTGPRFSQVICQMYWSFCRYWLRSWGFGLVRVSPICCQFVLLRVEENRVGQSRVKQSICDC